MVTEHGKIALIHSGSQEDIEICVNIETNLLKKNIKVEFQKLLPEKNREGEMNRRLKQYEAANDGVFVIISKDFFQVVWPTALKNNILQTITKYTSKRCLHIWTNVDEIEVKQRSTQLANNDGVNFRRVSYSQLHELKSDEISGRLNKLLNEWNSDEMYKRDYEAKSRAQVKVPVIEMSDFIDTSISKHLYIPTPKYISKTVSSVQSPSSRIYPHETAIKLIDISACSTYDDQRQGQCRQNKRAESRRRHKATSKHSKTTPIVTSETLLSSIKYKDIFGLSDLLGELSCNEKISSVGNDVSELSASLGLSGQDMQQLKMAHLRGQRPLELMIRTLNMRQPHLTLGHLEGNLRSIHRLDAVNYIHEHVYSC
jgi:hypothetical protein